MSEADRLRDVSQGTGCTPAKRAVVALLRGGIEESRYPSIAEAARAMECSIKHVEYRCKRKCETEDEFRYRGCTFRFAEEWDAMSEVDRMRDIPQDANCVPAKHVVVALLRGGIETGRYPSAKEAALARACSLKHVERRCRRKSEAKDEFRCIAATLSAIRRSGTP